MAQAHVVSAPGGQVFVPRFQDVHVPPSVVHHCQQQQQQQQVGVDADPFLLTQPSTRFITNSRFHPHLHHSSQSQSQSQSQSHFHSFHQSNHHHHHHHHYRRCCRPLRVSLNSYQPPNSQQHEPLDLTPCTPQPSSTIHFDIPNYSTRPSLPLTPPSSTPASPATTNFNLASPWSCVHSFPKTMSVVATSVHVHHDTLPSSPPDLTESKSSKSSSSLRSSCLTDATGQENLSHFEDIALADSGRDSDDSPSHPHHHGKPLRKPPTRSMTHSGATVYSRSNAARSFDSSRDSTNSVRPSYPSLKGHVHGVMRDQQEQRHQLPHPHQRQGRALSNARALRRGMTSPSTVSIGTMSTIDRSSRSPSPNRFSSQSGSRSPRSVGSASSSFASNYRTYSRKNLSAQPQQRKTVKELEDEYHDSDEEVPEDAVIWNVPISPRPPIAATPLAVPEPLSMQVDGASLPLAKHESAPAEPPRSPKRAGMVRSATSPSSPPDTLAATGRTKSWTKDLSEEARELTAALEAHEVEMAMNERRQSVADRSSDSSVRPKLRTKTSVMELPPLQKGNIMIDPLPVSKEKEAVLSRTRPSWLPPKSQKEERKHLREWERMMTKAAEAERRREEKQREEERTRRQIGNSIARIWEQHVIPNWDLVVREPRTRELWWRGVTSRDRGTVWKRAIGNELSLSEASYTAALGRARALRDSLVELPTEERSKHKDAAWLDAIARDVPTVFPELGIFTTDAPLHDTLTDVLLAYAAYRSDVAYVYGTHHLAGLLVLNLPAEEAFITLANLLNRPMPLAFLVNDGTDIRRAMDLVLATLKYKMPRLHDHLTSPSLALDPEEWLAPFLMTLGAAHLGPEAVSRIWDVMVFEGDKAIVRAAVGMLSLLESRLYGDRDEVLKLFGWGAERWTMLDDEVMMATREAGKASISPSSSSSSPSPNSAVSRENTAEEKK